jgi:zinc transport system substrate-binding protein
MRNLSSYFIGIFILPIIIAGFAGPYAVADEGTGNTKILTTFFPLYLFAENICQGIDGIEVTNLLPSSYGCPHDFALAPADLKKIHEADIIVENGLGLEAFMEEAVRTGNSHARIVVATENIKPIKLRYYDPHEAGIGDTLLQFNPHAFASPQEAAVMVETITERFANLLPQYAERIRSNGSRYKASLDSLSAEFADSLQSLKNPRVVTVHEVLDYMARDYGFKIVDVVEKEPGQDPSAKEMVALVNTLRQSRVAALFSEPQYSTKAIQTISKELGIPTFEIDPVASGSDRDIPLDYYQKRMRDNLTILIKVMK